MTSSQHKKTNNACLKRLNKNDPIDKLIIELVEKSILDISVVEIRDELQILEAQKYSKKLPHQRKKVLMIPSTEMH